MKPYLAQEARIVFDSDGAHFDLPALRGIFFAPAIGKKPALYHQLATSAPQAPFQQQQQRQLEEASPALV